MGMFAKNASQIFLYVVVALVVFLTSPSSALAIQGNPTVSVTGGANGVFLPGQTATISLTATTDDIGAETLVTVGVLRSAVANANLATFSPGCATSDVSFYVVCERPVNAGGASTTISPLLTVTINEGAAAGSTITVPIIVSDEIPGVSGSIVGVNAVITIGAVGTTPPPATACSTAFPDARCVTGVLNNATGNIGCPTASPNLVSNPTTPCSGSLLCCSASAPTMCESVPGAVCVQPANGGNCPTGSGTPRVPANFECDGTDICCRTVDVTATSECVANYGSSHRAQCLESCVVSDGWFGLSLPGSTCGGSGLICCSRFNPDFYNFQDRTTCVGPLGRGVTTAIGCIPALESAVAFTQYMLTWGSGIAGGVAIALVSYGGFMIMSAAGDAKKVQAGKELVTATITGLMFLIFAALLLRLIGADILGIFPS
jgi:hypothetical protein